MQIYLANRAQSLCLPEGETRSLHLRVPTRVRAQAGLVWLTVEQAAPGPGGADIWLRAGQEVTLGAQGLVVVEAVDGDAVLEIVPQPSPSLLSSFSSPWARLANWCADALRRRRSAPALPQASPQAPDAGCCTVAAPAEPVHVTRLLPRGLIRWF